MPQRIAIPYSRSPASSIPDGHHASIILRYEIFRDSVLIKKPSASLKKNGTPVPVLEFYTQGEQDFVFGVESTEALVRRGRTLIWSTLFFCYSMVRGTHPACEGSFYQAQDLGTRKPAGRSRGAVRWNG